jgi:SAM-dependent methyltransferase
MAQETTGLKAILSIPRAYDLAQNLIGARAARREFAARYVRAETGQTIVDVGCGTGELAPHLGRGVHYVGFDLSPRYIEAARARFSGIGRFECMDVADAADLGISDADIAVAFGLLHHLDDVQCISLFRSLAMVLRESGRVVTIDPTFAPGQHAIAAFLAGRDRGRNVRSPSEYEGLARLAFSDVRCHTRHDLLRLPYSHCIMEMRGAIRTA